MTTYAFIDASNIIYGTRDEGWKVDFAKLYQYLHERFQCKVIYYFGGVEFDKTKQIKFYSVLNTIGYTLILKPVKLFQQPDGTTIRKANCDVDLTFYAMRDRNKFARMILFSGDGDFEVLLNYFITLRKNIVIFANAKRTAREIKKIKKIQFNDLTVLKTIIEKK